MAIHADFIGNKTVENAIVKLDSIWGSKKVGWNAWVHVFSREDLEVPISVFSVTALYIEDQNPYEALYGEISKLSFLKNVTHDNIIENMIEAKEVMLIAEPIIIPVIRHVEEKSLFEQLDEKPKKVSKPKKK